MQQVPWSAKTKAPASSAKSPPLSLVRVTVRPEAVLVLPHTYTPEFLNIYQ